MSERSSGSIFVRLYLASFLTALLACVMFRSNIYPGTPYGWSDAGPAFAKALASLFFFAIPIAVFAFFLMLPFVAVGFNICVRLDRNARWRTFLVCGAALGIPAMVFYAALLGLGLELWVWLGLNGGILGLVCAALVRQFLPPKIDDAVLAEAE